MRESSSKRHETTLWIHRRGVSWWYGTLRLRTWIHVSNASNLRALEWAWMALRLGSEVDAIVYMFPDNAFRRFMLVDMGLTCPSFWSFSSPPLCTSNQSEQVSTVNQHKTQLTQKVHKRSVHSNYSLHSNLLIQVNTLLAVGALEWVVGIQTGELSPLSISHSICTLTHAAHALIIINASVTYCM